MESGNFFSDGRTMTSTVCDHALKARDDFLQLLNSASDRDYLDDSSVWFSSLPQVAEQNLEGLCMPDRDKKKAKAEEDEAMLEHFADRMADIYGECPTVPWWAHENAEIPDNYV